MKEKGITLVALVITIIVLIILAGVSISLVVGDNGIITKAQQGKQNMSNASAEEREQLQNLDNAMNELNTGSGPIVVPPKTDGTWDDTTEVNSPDLDGTGLTGITIGEDGSVTEIEEGQEDWYSYTADDRRWANAKTADGSMWVWIPRYAYKITYDVPTDKSQGGTVDIVFLQGDTNLDKNGNDVTQSTYQDEQGQTGAYTVHPAFKDGTSNGFSNGEWDDEIEGLWIAKFEAGYAEGNNSVTKVDSGLKYGVDCTTSNLYGAVTANSTPLYYPVFLPKSYSYNFTTIDEAYNLTRALTQTGNPYGLASAKVDSHLIKNSEWGAVAFLTHSKYGRNKEEITINNVSLENSVNTIYAVTGMAGASVSAEKNITTIDKVNDGSSGSYSWETANGQKASTTGNAYGIYDLSGGAWERVAGYINNGDVRLNNFGNNLVNTGGAANSTKYKSVYAYNTGSDTSANNFNQAPNPSRIGEAIWEVSNSSGDDAAGWNQDAFFFAYADTPFLARGGSTGGKTSAGVFYCDSGSGNPWNGNGFRAVLIAL